MQANNSADQSPEFQNNLGASWSRQRSSAELQSFIAARVSRLGQVDL